MKLTPKQARFASLVAQGQTKAQAYRSAYNAKGMNPSAIKTEAYKLSKVPHVAAAIDDLRNNHQPSNRTVEQLSKDGIIQRLQLEATDESNPPSSRVRALEILAKHLGMFKDQITVVETRSVGEIERDLERLLGTLTSSES